jgi:hypothetical protein
MQSTLRWERGLVPLKERRALPGFLINSPVTDLFVKRTGWTPEPSGSLALLKLRYSAVKALRAGAIRPMVVGAVLPHMVRRRPA